jgi:hypothetical protein
MKTKKDMIQDIKNAINQTFKERHFSNRRWNRTALDEIREYILTIRRIA